MYRYTRLGDGLDTHLFLSLQGFISFPPFRLWNEGIINRRFYLSNNFSLPKINFLGILPKARRLLISTANNKGA